MELVRATIMHNDCWSPFLASFPDVKGELLTQNVNSTSVIANIAFHSPNLRKKEYFVKFFRKMKVMDAILEIKQVKSNETRDTRLVNIVAKRDKSISGLVFETGSLVFKEFFYRGYEVWYISPGSCSEVDLRKKLSERAQLIDWEVVPADQYLNMFSVLQDTVKPKYEELLYVLYEKGYFDYPHKITLEEIARMLGTTKSNITRKIRNIEKDMASRYQKRKEISHVIEQSVSRHETDE